MPEFRGCPCWVCPLPTAPESRLWPPPLQHPVPTECPMVPVLVWRPPSRPSFPRCPCGLSPVSTVSLQAACRCSPVPGHLQVGLELRGELGGLVGSTGQREDGYSGQARHGEAFPLGPQGTHWPQVPGGGSWPGDLGSWSGPLTWIQGARCSPPRSPVPSHAQPPWGLQ